MFSINSFLFGHFSFQSVLMQAASWSCVSSCVSLCLASSSFRTTFLRLAYRECSTEAGGRTQTQTHTHRRRAEHKYMHSCRLQHVGEVAGRTPPLSCQTNDNLINSFWFWFCEIRCPWDKLDQKRLRHDHSNNAIQCLYNEGHFCFSFYWHQFWISFK